MTVTLSSCLICSAFVAVRQAEPPDAVYLNATVITLDAEHRVVEALAIKGDRLVVLGTSADLRNLRLMAGLDVGASTLHLKPPATKGHGPCRNCPDDSFNDSFIKGLLPRSDDPPFLIADTRTILGPLRGTSWRCRAVSTRALRAR